MSIFEPSPWSDRVLAILRIVAGAVFITSGTMKMFGFPASPAAAHSAFSLVSQIGIGAVLEVFGGLAIVLGAFTRPVAFILSGEMAVAYFQFHFPRSFFPTVNQGTPAVLYCFVYLYLSFAGAGAWSIDRVIARSRRGRPVRS